MKKLIVSSVFLTIMSLYSYGQFTLDGELRPRFEYRHGYKNVADSSQNSAAFVEQRTRLNFGYKTEGYIFKLTLQDVHIWGSQPQLVNTYSKTNTDGSLLSIHEAWGEALLNDYWSFKFGRQEIALDDHRIFGNVGWASQARSHDAAILKLKKDKFQLQIGGAYNQDRAALANTVAARGSYKALQYVWLNNKFNENFNASILFLNNGKEQLDSTRFANQPVTAIYYDNYSQTAGTRLVYKKGKFALSGAFYYQTGVHGDRTKIFSDVDGRYNKEIEAMNYSAEIAYKPTKKFSTTLGYEYMSGQSQTDTSFSYRTVNHAFTPFYGTNHKFNGFMDYFYVGNHVGSVGLQDIYLKLKYKHEKFWVGTDVHLFMAAEDVLDGYKISEDINTAINNGTPITDVDMLQAMSASLGTEIDLTFGFNLSKGVAFKGGYSVMIDTETLAYLKGVTDYKGQGRTDQNNGWGWAMIIIKPQFIAAKKK